MEDLDEPGPGTATPPMTPGDEERWAWFDRWSGNLFLLLAVLELLVLLAFGGLAGSLDLPAPVVVATLAIAAVGAVQLVIASFALDRHRAWARTTARWLLWILVLTGVGGALLDLLQPKFTLPLAAIAAIVVLRRQPGPIPALGGRDGRIATAIAAVFLASSLGVGVPGWLVSPQSPLIAGRDKLELTVTTDCPAAGVVPPAAAPVTATVTWRWLSRDIVPIGDDAIELAWPVLNGAVQVQRDRVELPVSAVEDRDSAAMRLLAQGDEGLSFVGTQAARYSLEIGGGAAGNGTLVVPLTVDTSAGGLVFDLEATYAHGGAWTRVATTRCDLAAAG